MFVATGTTVFVPLEGGFWGIIGSDEKKYCPDMTLSPEYQKEGLKVEFVYEPSTKMSLTMWGRLITLKSIQLLP